MSLKWTQKITIYYIEKNIQPSDFHLCWLLYLYHTCSLVNDKQLMGCERGHMHAWHDAVNNNLHCGSFHSMLDYQYNITCLQ